MALQLLINDTDHFFVDTDLGVQVGQAHQEGDGSWSVEVNDGMHTAPDLESAKRLFLRLYDPSLVVSQGAYEGEVDESEFEVIDLTA
jgi:hypothetical protein